jgi:hypothetical protein
MMERRWGEHSGETDGAREYTGLVQKSFAIFGRFNHRRIFSFYLCYSDSR